MQPGGNFNSMIGEKFMTSSSSKKTNILFIIDYLYDQGGTERHLKYLLQLLNREKFNCYLLAFDTGATEFTKSLTDAGVDIEHVPVGRYYTFNAFYRAFHVYSYIKKKQIDIVHTFGFKSDFYGVIVAKISGVKVIISSKRDNADIKKRIQFFFNIFVRRLISRYIAVSDRVRDVVHNKEKVKLKNIEVIYNGVDLNVFSSPTAMEKKNAKKKLGFAEDDFVIGTVAWMRKEKDYPTLFKAFIHAKKDIPQLKLVLVGGGTLLEKYKQYIHEEGLTDDVCFVGPVNDVRPYLNALDVGCLVPSCNEGFSNAIIEMMASGLPVVATDVGGNSEAVLNGVNGCIIPPSDHQLLSEAFVYLFENDNERKNMGLRSFERVMQEFSLLKMIERHEMLYFSLINQNDIV
jgi:glycosyltransferase involved in cell wall biosynthesis